MNDKPDQTPAPATTFRDDPPKKPEKAPENVPEKVAAGDTPEVGDPAPTPERRVKL